MACSTWHCSRLALTAGPTLLLATAFAGSDAGPAAVGAAGGQIAFVRAANGGFYDDTAFIYVMNADGSGIRRLTKHAHDHVWPAYDYAPAWSPDGRKIAFLSRRDDGSQNSGVFLVNADGSAETRLTREQVSHLGHVWSPDGARIAVSRSVEGNSRIFVLNADGSDLRRLTGEPENDSDYEDQAPTWSSDGTKIAFQRERLRRNPADTGDAFIHRSVADIYVVGADGSGVRRLTRLPGRSIDARWSPDGSRIAFVHYPSGYWNEHLHRYREGDIYVMNADGSGLVKIAGDTVRELDPAWSPDSKRIAFAKAYDGTTQIYVVNADGSGLKRLSGARVGRYDTRPVWSPEGTRIAFESNRTGKGDIYVMNADGSGVRRLTTSPRPESEPAWSPAAGGRP